VLEYVEALRGDRATPRAKHEGGTHE
jgi:hypothetical protein